MTRAVGPLLVIIRRMSKDIFNFLSIAGLVLLLFSCAGMILFNVPSFENFGDSIITLYSWMLGDFDFTDMAPEGVKGSLFLALYLLISLVLLLNLLIAVLSSTFSHLQSHGVGLYLQSLIDQFPRYSYHPTLNFLTFHSLPLDFLSLIFLPCAKRPSSRCGVFLEAIYYFPLYLLVLVGLLALDVLFFPFAFFTILKKYCISIRPLKFFLTLFFFPLSLPLFLVSDFILASVQLWSSPSKNN